MNLNMKFHRKTSTCLFAYGSERRSVFAYVQKFQYSRCKHTKTTYNYGRYSYSRSKFAYVQRSSTRAASQHILTNGTGNPEIHENGTNESYLHGDHVVNSNKLNNEFTQSPSAFQPYRSNPNSNFLEDTLSTNVANQKIKEIIANMNTELKNIESNIKQFNFEEENKSTKQDKNIVLTKSEIFTNKVLKDKSLEDDESICSSLTNKSSISEDSWSDSTSVSTNTSNSSTSSSKTSKSNKKKKHKILKKKKKKFKGPSQSKNLFTILLHKNFRNN